MIEPGGGIRKDLITVGQAGIRVMFEADKKGKHRRTTFKVYPSSCTLGDHPMDERVKTCLKRWKIDISERATSNTSKPGEPAQYRIWS